MTFRLHVNHLWYGRKQTYGLPLTSWFYFSLVSHVRIRKHTLLLRRILFLKVCVASFYFFYFDDLSDYFITEKNPNRNKPYT